MQDYLRAFIVGSSWPVIASHFYRVPRIRERTYPFSTYALVAPPFLGVMNAIGLGLAKRFQLGTTTRFLLTGALSAAFVSWFATYTKAYRYDAAGWRRYYARIGVTHFILFSIIIRGLEALLNTK